MITSRWPPVGRFLLKEPGCCTSVSNSRRTECRLLIYSLLPVLTPAIAWFLLPDGRLSPRGFLGVLVGVGIIIQPDPTSSFNATLVGRLLVFGAAASVTLETVLVRRNHPSMSIVALTAWAMIIGAVIQYSFRVVLGESITTVQFTLTALLILVYLRSICEWYRICRVFHATRTV